VTKGDSMVQDEASPQTITTKPVIEVWCKKGGWVARIKGRRVVSVCGTRERAIKLAAADLVVDMNDGHRPHGLGYQVGPTKEGQYYDICEIPDPGL
jgi:hypothetical protein